MPAGDEHGDALDPGAECRYPHARLHNNSITVHARARLASADTHTGHTGAHGHTDMSTGKCVGNLPVHTLVSSGSSERRLVYLEPHTLSLCTLSLCTLSLSLTHSLAHSLTQLTHSLTSLTLTQKRPDPRVGWQRSTTKPHEPGVPTQL